MTDPNRPKRSAYERALDMLEARARSVSEMRRLLLHRGESPADVDTAIARLCESGLLDDANYARQMARSKAVGAGQSRRRIRQELSRRGVAAEIAADAVETVFAEEEVDEDASIERVARKKLRSMGDLDDATRKRRLYGFLARRGYEVDDIARVIRIVLNDD